MTSESEALKTNEFLRRRKLRLQQVREQSKDIAKKIRQRAKVETLRQVVDLDAKKQKEYFHRQDQLIKHLEVLYDKGIKNIGASHISASEVTLQDDIHENTDLSKIRGKEAAAELRKKRQEKLDEQKKKLDRRLQARESANELSREKSTSVVNKVLTKSTSKSSEELKGKASGSQDIGSKEITDTVAKNDMATQWDLEGVSQEWEPNIPALSLPQEDSVKETNNNYIESKSDKSKRIDLFALSEEMPFSLRGSVVPDERVSKKPSLSLVSEYLQNRGLRLREPDTTCTSRGQSSDLQSLRQTIQRTRAAKPEAKANDKRSSVTNSAASKKNAVTVYNHTTRDSRDIPFQEEGIVARDLQSENDAYSQAMKESSQDAERETGHQKKLQQIRSKVAMTKQSVEKEYKDTMSFLNSLPKDGGSRPIRKAYMDERRQQMQTENRQQKLQHEYRNIEKECRRHSCRKNTKSRSPPKDDDFDKRDFQYSWMPVPDGDGELAVHTVPTALRAAAPGLRLSKVDSYHEYRSRHKHTPPTKDTARRETLVGARDTSDSTSGSSDISLQKTRNDIGDMSDAERIIIYKVLNSKKEKKCKKKKLIKDIAKSLTSIDKLQKSFEGDKEGKRTEANPGVGNRVSFEQINEGIYKTVNENRDNVTSMYFADHPEERSVPDSLPCAGACRCRAHSALDNRPGCTCLQSENKKIPSTDRMPVSCGECTCSSVKPKKQDAGTGADAQPSAATSTSSFRTATNDKANSAPDGGFLRLVDEGGEETGKFYIGASGFLKDDNYEVVIQLRKKGADARGDETDKNPVKEATESMTRIDDAPKPESTSAECNKSGGDTATTERRKVSEPPSILKISEESSNTTQPSASGSADARDGTTAPNDMSDKAVCTSQASCTASADQPKLDPPSRPATSTYTQTTNNSPTHRPVFFHMSSSTSTAYMSPPELVLPKFLRPGYQISEDDMFIPLQNLEKKFETTEQGYCNEYGDCRCKRCVHARKEVLRNKAYCKFKKDDLRTPPNTARSCTSREDYDVYSRDRTETSPKRASSTDANRRCQCRKCGARSRSDTKKHNQSKNHVATKHCTRNIGPSIQKKANLHTDKRSKPILNPIIKSYVNQLLALNRDSLKAVEVVELECSSVETPASSIINAPNNTDETKPLQNKISLEQIKNILKQQILNEISLRDQQGSPKTTDFIARNLVRHDHSKFHRMTRKKTPHKVKSLNISKHLLKTNSTDETRPSSVKQTSSQWSSSNKESKDKNHILKKTSIHQPRSKSSPTSRQVYETEVQLQPRRIPTSNVENFITKNKSADSDVLETNKPPHRSKSSILGLYKGTLTSTSPECDSNGHKEVLQRREMPTQTNEHLDSDTHFMKIAEDKLQNMEKIADLTEKCTKRLSNLAKVLEEVRKNKSLAYSQISSSDSTCDSDRSKPEKTAPVNRTVPQLTVPIDEINNVQSNSPRFSPLTNESRNELNSAEYNIPFLSDIPKPDSYKSPESSLINAPISHIAKPNRSSPTVNVDHSGSKIRGKPPPALSRIHLKNGQEHVIPHELSTVIEVDSPMSVKLKNQSRHDSKNDVPDVSNRLDNTRPNQVVNINPNVDESHYNPDVIQSNHDLTKYQTKVTVSAEESKLQMIDMKQFNEIMLKPFFSINEYAKQCNVGLEEGSNLEDVVKDDGVNDEISSLHSDGSLPDVIAELLKRNIISEPFKYDTASNINSTTVSSESTLSVLALSKIRKEKRKSSVVFKHQENIAETSDTLSMSSNPDLENAFKKLGMGWASSTLKKTKERLALSSSSNTSSSSLSHFKVKSFNDHDVPALVTDSMSSAMNASRKPQGQGRHSEEISKNVEQQTSQINSMTVKEFLATELAKRITFTNKSRNDTEEEFISLFETKMPEEMKHSTQLARDERSADNSTTGVRARTSTPVQLFKSMTYRSSSSSNASNGLFSNIDDLSSVKVTSNSMKHSTSDKDDLTIPNCSLIIKKCSSDCSKSD